MGVRGTSQQPRTPLWVIGAAVLLNVAGYARPARVQRTSAWKNDWAHLKERSTEADRGRKASSPAEIPAKGWKDVALRVYGGINQDRILAIAAGVTFYVLLALFPAIAGLIALYGLYADANTVGQHLSILSGLLPEGGLQIIREQLERLTAQPPHRLGIATFIALAVSLWSANGGMKAIFDALNVVYHEEETRGFIRLNAVSLAFTLSASVFVLVALAAMTVLPALLGYLGLSQLMEVGIKIARWPVLLIVVSFAIALIYRYGPSRNQPQWRWITPGSAFATLGWLCASLLFSWYTENFGNYNEAYGSLGATIGFMTWLWLSNIVILVGAKLNAETEHQTARDSTVGQPRPRGQRGAVMADAIGRAQS